MPTDIVTANITSMTSREIAELTGKRHDHILRDCRAMFDELELDAPNFGETYFDSMNREQTEFRLDKRRTLTLTSGYSLKQRDMIVGRWLELEAGKQMMTRLELAKEQVRLIEELDAAEETVKTLNTELDYSHEWATIKKVEKATGEHYCWRRLKAASIEIDCPRRDIFDANYGSVKSYNADLWAHCYGVDIASLPEGEPH
jgi:phage regulator Rha-like protein